MGGTERPAKSSSSPVTYCLETSHVARPGATFLVRAAVSGASDLCPPEPCSLRCADGPSDMPLRSHAPIGDFAKRRQNWNGAAGRDGYDRVTWCHCRSATSWNSQECHPSPDQGDQQISFVLSDRSVGRHDQSL